MKKLILLFSIIILSLSVKAQTEEMQQLITDANSKYAESDFATAIELYSNVVEQGYEASELYYNLANSYFKNKNLAKSILYYEKAKLLAPEDKKIVHNLRFAQQFVVDEIEVIPQFFLYEFFEKIAKLFKTDTWAVLSVSFFIFTLLTLIVMFFSKIINRKRLALLCAFIFFTFSVFTFFMANKMNNNTKGKNAGIIMSVVTIKSSPDETSTDLFLLHEGVKIGITDNIDNWYEIKLADGRVGWLKSEYLGVI